MNVEELKDAAWKYIQGITTTHPTLALPRDFLPENIRSTSLASLVEKLDLSASSKSTFQVGIFTSQIHPSGLARNDSLCNSCFQPLFFWANMLLKNMIVNTTVQTKKQQFFYANGYLMLSYPLKPLQKPRHIQRVSLFSLLRWSGTDIR